MPGSVRWIGSELIWSNERIIRGSQLANLLRESLVCAPAQAAEETNQHDKGAAQKWQPLMEVENQASQ
jgi:hypothetical protein